MLMCVTFAVFSLFALFGAFFSIQDAAWANAIGYVAFAFLMARFSLRAFREYRTKDQVESPSDDQP